MEYSYDYYFNEEKYCFYLKDKITKYEDIYNAYKNDEKAQIEDDKYEIIIGKYIYPLENPGYVKFILPDGNEREVFISSTKHIEEILFIYNKYDFFYCKDDTENYLKFSISELEKIYPVKKIKISTKEYTSLYNSNNKLIKRYEDLNPKDLSFSFGKYLKNSNNIEENIKFFNYTNKRKELYEILETELKNKNSFIPICGPEGIGKTTSILAFCRINLKFKYFYYNARVFSELIKINNSKEIEKLLIEELSHCILSNKLNNLIENIMNIKSFSFNAIEFLIHILSKIGSIKVLIIDQYKTSLDEEYYFLKKLLKAYQSSFNIILLSSMNEDDVKGSVINGIKKVKKSEDNFFLDYLYIGELTKVSDNDNKTLNEDEKYVLNLFGNLYSIFYEIIEFRKKNRKFEKKNFLKKIQEDIKKNLQNYYKNKQDIEIYHSLTELLDIELTKLGKETFLNVYENIPFRYIKLNIDKKNIFKISEIKNDSKYEFEYIYNYLLKIILNLKGELFNKMEKDEKLIDSLKKGISPITFENNVFYYIWGSRCFNGENIKKRVEITSIYNLKKDDCTKINDIKEEISIGDGFILSQGLSNALSFDTGLLVRKTIKNWKLYLIQITKKKDSDERITLTSLNDYFGFLKAFLKENCGIFITENYFCYIFDAESIDTPTVNYCKDNNLNYKFFNKTKYKIKEENINIKEYKMKKKIIINNKNESIPEKEFEIKKKYPKKNDFEETKKFLKRKREIMRDKNLKIKDLEERINKKKKYYDSINKNFKKEKKMDYNDKEEEIKNYLVNKEFVGKDLVGIKLLTPNQNDCLIQMKELGFTNDQINNFYELIGINKKEYLILNIQEIKYFIPSLSIPEYLTYILIKTDQDIIFLDYENKKSYMLSNKEEIDFLDIYNGEWKYISITFINKNMSLI